jgi:hypothetical protein
MHEALGFTQSDGVDKVAVETGKKIESFRVAALGSLADLSGGIA